MLGVMPDDLPRPSRESSSKLEIPVRPLRVIAAEVVADIDHSLGVLREWGVRVPDDSRLDKARRVLVHAAETGVLVPKHRGDFLGLRSLEMAFDYAAIADTLPPRRVAALRRELRDSLSGEIDPPEAARGPLQLQSQCIVRAAFVRGGVWPTHPTHSPRQGLSSPDLLLADPEAFRSAVETKRPREARNIIARFDEGCGQLVDFGLPGGVLVDVTDCLRHVPRAEIDDEVRRVALTLYGRVFKEGRGHLPGYEHIMVAGAFSRVGWTSNDGEDGAIVDVHTSSAIAIFAAAPDTDQERRARWIRERFQNGLDLLSRTLAETSKTAEPFP